MSSATKGGGGGGGRTPKLPAFFTRQTAEAASQSARCQKCCQRGHWTYQCTGKRKYLERESHTKDLEKRMRVSAAGHARAIVGPAGVSAKKKAPAAKRSSSSSSSSSSGSASDSDSSASSSSSSSSSASDSEEDDATRQKKIDLLKRMIELRKQQQKDGGGPAPDSD